MEKQGLSLQQVQIRAEALLFLNNFQMDFSIGIPYFSVIHLTSSFIHLLYLFICSGQRMCICSLFSCAKLNPFPFALAIVKDPSLFVIARSIC